MTLQKQKIPNRKIKVCIVEDEEMISEIYRARLEEEDFQVYTANDGSKGYELIKKVEPDIALIDIMMPAQNGIELIRKIRKEQKIAHTPIIILTNIDNSDTVEQTYDLEVDFYLIKSQYQPSDVAQIVREVLDTKHIV